MTVQAKFRTAIISPALRWMGAHSPAAERLLYGTAMHESAGLLYARQIEGPARGAYQMEPATLADLWANWLFYRPAQAQWLRAAGPAVVLGAEGKGIDPAAAINLFSPLYATVAARLHYMRDPEPLPDAEDLESLARYYKRVWNTHLGKASEQDFVDAVQRYED